MYRVILNTICMYYSICYNVFTGPLSLESPIFLPNLDSRHSPLSKRFPEHTIKKDEGDWINDRHLILAPRADYLQDLFDLNDTKMVLQGILFPALRTDLLASFRCGYCTSLFSPICPSKAIL